MTIAIQSTNATLAALEALTNQSGASQTAANAAGVPQALLDPTSTDASSGSSATIFDLSGGAAAAALGGLTGGLSTAASAADAAVSAGTTIETLLTQMQQAAQSASDPSLSSDSRSQLNAGFKADMAQIQQAIASASVDGVNLLDGSAVNAQASAGATLSSYDLSLGGPLIGVSADAGLSTATSAAGLADELGQALDNVTQAIGEINTQGQAIQSHLTVISQAASALAPGLAGSINGSLDGDGARLQALQVQQQLSDAGGAISNQAPQAILALFNA
jgi:flagellin